MDYLIDLKKQNLSGKVALEGGISLGVDTAGNIKKIDETGAISDIGGSVDESRLLPDPTTVPAGLAGHPVVFDVQEQGGAGDANTLLLMHFDDDTVDYSPNGHSATKTGDVAFQTGKFGKCLKFAAASGGSYLQIPNAPVFNLASLSAWTFDVLVYLTQTPGYNAVLVKRNASSPVSYQFCFSSGTRKPQLYTGSAYVATGEVPLNTWTHVAFTYLNGTLKIWIGGQLDSTFTNVSLTDYDLPVKIGYHYSSTTEQFIGLLDELRLSSCDRTADPTDPMYSADGTSFTPPAKPYGVTSNRFKVSDQPSGTVKSVNGQLPDESGNVTVETGGAVDESRLLPENPANGDIPCYSNEPPEGVNYNDANTVLLLQGSSNNTAAASTSDRLNGIVTGSFPTQADGSILVNGSDNYITCNNADTRRVFGGEFTIEMYIKTAQFTSTGTRQDTNWYKLSGYGKAQVVNISDFYASTAGTYGIWPYGLLSGETFPKNAQNGVYQHLAIDVYMVGSTRKFTMYLNGIAYYTGTYWSSPADWDDSYTAAVKIFGDDSTHLQNASVMSLRVSNIARYKGVSFDPPADGKYLNPPAGYWNKLNKSELVKSVNGQIPDSSGSVTLPEATASAAGLMAAADKAVIAGLTTHGIYPNASVKSGAVDFNEVIDHGFYFIGGDTPHLNYPETYKQSGGTLQVIRNGNYLTQFFSLVGTNKEFFRSCLNVLSDSSERTFSAWQRLLTHIDFVEYIARPGYFKLPDGLFVQWGAASNITADGTTPVVFQIAFPHLMLTGYATAVSGGGSASGVVISVSGISTTGMNLITKNHPGGDKDINIHWLAIGY